MKILEFDWQTLIGPVTDWQGLAPSSRRLLQESLPGSPLQLAPFGSDGAVLARAKILKPYVDGLRAAPTEEARPFLAFMRLLHRAPILARPTLETLVTYLTEVFLADERGALARRFGTSWGHDEELAYGLMLEGHLRSFRETKDPRSWEEPRREDAYYAYRNNRRSAHVHFADSMVAAEARHLAERLAAARDPIPFLDLWSNAKSRDHVALAALALVRYGLAFPAEHPADGSIVITLWPAVSARLHRTSAHEPKSVTPSADRSTAFALDDLEQLLVAIAREPLKVRAQDGAPYEKRRREIQATQRRQIDAVDEFHARMRDADGWRTIFALEHARLLGWTNIGPIDSGSGWVVTDEARAWLQKPREERHKWIFDALRMAVDRVGVAKQKAGPKPHRFGRSAAPEPDPDADEDSKEFDLWDGGLQIDEIGPLSDDLPFLPPLHLWVGLMRQVEQAEHVVAAFSDLPVGEFFDLEEFLRHRAQERCPMIAKLSSPRVARLAAEGLEAEWREMLLLFLHTRLLSFGAAIAGEHGPERRLSFALTPLAAYLFGSMDEWPGSGEEVAEKLVIVQPNFDIVFPSPAFGIESRLVAFADRRPDHERTVLRITRASVSRAVNAGSTADAMIETLAAASLNPIPRNVEREIRGWAQATLTLEIEQVAIVRCGDHDAALRLVAEAGAGARLIGTTVVELPSGKKLPEIVRKLRAQGVFLTMRTERARPRR